jgi:hypothetical protein
VILIFHPLDYKQIEDIRGQCDTLSKKAVIARLRGNASLAEEWAGQYIALYNSHMNALSSVEDTQDDQGSETLDL